METDIDFAEQRNNTVKARRRVRLCFLALLACVIMMADLISSANAMDRTQLACSHSAAIMAEPVKTAKAEIGTPCRHRL